MSPSVPAPSLDALSEVAAATRAQLPARIVFGVVIAVGAAILTGRLELGTVWFLCYIGGLLLSRTAADLAIQGRLKGWPARVLPSLFAGFAAAAFCSVTAALLLEGGLAGAICAVLILAAGSLNLLTLGYRHMGTTAAGMCVYAGYLAMLPVFAFPSVGPGPTAVIVLSVLGYLANGLMLWRRWSEVTESERGQRAELDRRRAEAEAATAAKSAFVAMVSHELRTPISGVTAAAAELERNAEDARQVECAAIVAESGRFMQTLLTDLLDIAKIEAGRMSVERIPFDLGRFAHDLGRFWTLEADRRGVPLRLEAAFGLPGQVVGDPTRLKQVLNNLLSNALKFTGPAGVRWSLDVGPVLNGRMLLSVRVTDSGEGIAPDRLERLFTPYDQTDASVARTHGGTGLGLAISRELARLMGGDLTVASPKGQGATFSLLVELEAAAQAQPRAPAPRTMDAVGGSRAMRVLVVDDHRLNRRTLALLLQPMGAEIAEAENGLEALERAGAEAFDLVLMDVMMPVLDGRAATRRLKAAPGPNKATPVIGVTGGDSPEEVLACFAAGMDACVAKPLSAEALYAAIDQCLSADAATQPERSSA